jgi:hypothetical protein
LTWRYVNLTRRLASVTETQGQLNAKQLELALRSALQRRQLKAASLNELCRRLRITVNYLDPNAPNSDRSKHFSYLHANDVVAFSALAGEVSVGAAEKAALSALALRQVQELVELAQNDPSWQPTAQQRHDWKAGLSVIAQDVPKVADECETVLREKAPTAAL